MRTVAQLFNQSPSLSQLELSLSAQARKMDFDWQNFSAFEGTLSTDLLLSTTIEEATEKVKLIEW